MAERKTVSLAELIKNKMDVMQKDDKPINLALEIPRLGGDIKLSFTKTDVKDFIEVTHDDKYDSTQLEEAGLNLIYTAVVEPNLKDKELQAEYECEAPTDIVKRIFSDGEQADIANFMVDKAGYKTGSVSLVEDLKN